MVYFNYLIASALFSHASMISRSPSPLRTQSFRTPRGNTFCVASRDCLLAVLSIWKFRNCMQYPSVAQSLLLQSLLLLVGCCGTRFARLYKKIYTRASLRQSSHNGRQTAGLYVVILSVPVCFEITCVRSVSTRHHWSCKSENHTHLPQLLQACRIVHFSYRRSLPTFLAAEKPQKAPKRTKRPVDRARHDRLERKSSAETNRGS